MDVRVRAVGDEPGFPRHVSGAVIADRSLRVAGAVGMARAAVGIPLGLLTAPLWFWCLGRWT